MNLVEQHGRNPGEFRVGLQPRQIDAMGHGDDPRCLADLAVEAGGVADRRSSLFAPLSRHKFGSASCREAARDQQQYLPAIGPGLVKQSRGDLCRLAGAWRRDEQRARRPAQGIEQLWQDSADRKRGAGHGTRRLSQWLAAPMGMLALCQTGGA